MKSLLMAMVGAMLAAAVAACIAACATIHGVKEKLPRMDSPLQTHAVKSIKSVKIARIAILPFVARGDAAHPVADGAGDVLTAELYSEMSLAGGWKLVAPSDVSIAMQKIGPTENIEQTALKLGREVSADGVLYGTVDTYKERVGWDYAAQSPAAVAFSLHLLDVATGAEVWSAKFAKAQKALTENLFNFFNFVQHRARWVKAHEIAQEGVRQAVKDLRANLTVVAENVTPLPARLT